MCSFTGHHSALYYISLHKVVTVSQLLQAIKHFETSTTCILEEKIWLVGKSMKVKCCPETCQEQYNWVTGFTFSLKGKSYYRTCVFISIHFISCHFPLLFAASFPESIPLQQYVRLCPIVKQFAGGNTISTSSQGTVVSIDLMMSSAEAYFTSSHRASLFTMIQTF